MPKWLEIQCASMAATKRVSKWLSKQPSEFSRMADGQYNVVLILNTALLPANIITAVGTDGILSITPLETGPLAAA